MGTIEIEKNILAALIQSFDNNDRASMRRCISFIETKMISEIKEQAEKQVDKKNDNSIQ